MGTIHGISTCCHESGWLGRTLPPKHSHPTLPTLVAVPKPPITKPASPEKPFVDFGSPTKKVQIETHEMESFKVNSRKLLTKEAYSYLSNCKLMLLAYHCTSLLFSRNSAPFRATGHGETGAVGQQLFSLMVLEPQWPLFLKVTPPKTRPFAIKTGVIWVLGCKSQKISKHVSKVVLALWIIFAIRPLQKTVRHIQWHYAGGSLLSWRRWRMLASNLSPEPFFLTTGSKVWHKA